MVAAREPANRPLVWGVIAAVAIAVAVGLALIGPPSEARKRRLDERRLEDLRTLTGAVEQYRMRYHRLPGSLSDIKREGWSGSLKDPITGGAYGYRLVDSVSYELCATFDRAADSTAGPRWPAELGWDHPAGRHCFRREARPARGVVPAMVQGWAARRPARWA